jgi:hypothetical protein
MKKSFGGFLCYGLEPLFFFLVVSFVWLFCSFGWFVGFVCSGGLFSCPFFSYGNGNPRFV